MGHLGRTQTFFTVQYCLMPQKIACSVGLIHMVVNSKNKKYKERKKITYR